MERYDTEKKEPLSSTAQEITPSSETFSQLDFYLKTKTLHHEVVGVSQKLIFDDTIKLEGNTATAYAKGDEKTKPAKTLQKDTLPENLVRKTVGSKKQSIEHVPLSSFRRRASFRNDSISSSAVGDDAGKDLELTDLGIESTGSDTPEVDRTESKITTQKSNKINHHRRPREVLKNYIRGRKTDWHWLDRNALRYRLEHRPYGALIKILNIFFSILIVLMYLAETRASDKHPLALPSILTSIEFICASFFTFDLLLVVYSGELNHVYTAVEEITEGSIQNTLIYVFTEGLLDLIVIVPIFSYIFEHGYDTNWIGTKPCEMGEHVGLCWKCFDMGFDVCSDVLTQPLRSLRFGIYLNLIKNLRLVKIFLMFQPTRLRSILNGSTKFLRAEPFVIYLLSFMAQFMCIVLLFASLFYVVDIQLFPFENKGEVRLTGTGTPITFGDCIYFILVTLGTIGYGDISPLSTNGYVVVVVVIVLCLCYIPNQVSRTVDIYQRGIAAHLQKYKTKQHTGHIIIIGPIKSSRLELFAREFFHDDRTETDSLQNITDLIVLSPEEKNAHVSQLLLDPFYWSRLHYVRGSISSRRDLRRAGFFHANCYSCLIFTGNSQVDTVSKFVLLKAFARKFHTPNKHMRISAQCDYREEAEELELYTDSHQDIFAPNTEICNNILAQATQTPGLLAFFENIVHTHDSSLYIEASTKENDQNHCNEYLMGATMEIYFVAFPDVINGTQFRSILKSLFCYAEEEHRPVLLIGVHDLSTNQIILNPDVDFVVDVDKMDAIVIASSYAKALDVFCKFRYATKNDHVEKPLFSANVEELRVKMHGQDSGGGKVIILCNGEGLTPKGLCRRIINFILHLQTLNFESEVTLVGNLPQHIRSILGDAIAEIRIILGDPRSPDCLREAKIEDATSILIFLPEEASENANLSRKHGFMLQTYEAVRHYLSFHSSSIENTSQSKKSLVNINVHEAECEPFVICESSAESTLIALEYLSTATQGKHLKRMYRAHHEEGHNLASTTFTLFAAGHCTSGTFNDTLFAQSLQAGMSKGTTYQVVNELVGFNPSNNSKPKKKIFLLVIPNDAWDSCKTFMDIQIYFCSYYECLSLALYRIDDYNGTSYIYTAPQPNTKLRKSDRVLVLI